MIGVLSFIIIVLLICLFIFFDRSKLLFGILLGGMINLIISLFVIFIGLSLNMDVNVATNIAILVSVATLSCTVVICTLVLLEKIASLNKE